MSRISNFFIKKSPSFLTFFSIFSYLFWGVGLDAWCNSEFFTKNVLFFIKFSFSQLFFCVLETTKVCKLDPSGDFRLDQSPKNGFLDKITCRKSVDLASLANWQFSCPKPIGPSNLYYFLIAPTVPKIPIYWNQNFVRSDYYEFHLWPNFIFLDWFHILAQMALFSKWNLCN